MDLTGRRGLSASPRREQSLGSWSHPPKTLASASALVALQPIRLREVRVWFEELMGESLHPDSVERPFLVLSIGASGPDRHLGRGHSPVDEVRILRRRQWLPC